MKRTQLVIEACSLLSSMCRRLEFLMRPALSDDVSEAWQTEAAETSSLRSFVSKAEVAEKGDSATSSKQLDFELELRMVDARPKQRASHGVDISAAQLVGATVPASILQLLSRCNGA